MKRAPARFILLFCLWLTAVPLVHADEGELPAPAPSAAASQPIEPKEVLNRLATVRGLALKRDVPVQQAARGRVRSAAAQMGARREARDAAARVEALFRLLDLVPEATGLASRAGEVVAEETGDAYNFTDQTLQIVSSANDQVGLDEIHLVRQYMHALQDQNFRLGRKFRRVAGNSEASLGLEALAEGDAIFSSVAYLASANSAEEIERLSMQEERVGTPQLDRAPGILEASLMFPHTQGERFVAALYEIGGWDAVNKAYDRPPRSSEQILHLDRYLADDEPKLVQIPDISASMAAWSVEDSGVFGELKFLYYLSGGLGPDAAATAAEGWGGDRYLLLKNNATGKYALAELSNWDTEQDAREFLAAVDDMMRWRKGVQQTVDTPEKCRWTSSRRAWYVGRNGTDVLLVIAPDDGALKSIVRRVLGFRP